jgi:segregation and condensation protein B
MVADGPEPPGPPGPGEPPSPGDGAPVPPPPPHDPSAAPPDPSAAPSDPGGAAVDEATGLPIEARRALEAIVMVAADPVEPQMLAQLLEVSVERVEEACAALAAVYEADDRGFVLARVAGGYRYQSHPDAAPYVERYVLEGQSARLSSAALETLAIVAYKQPLSRAQVASIRGVNVDGVVRTLVHRGLVAEVARDPGPGQAVLYGTTRLFLERIGLNDLTELPPLGHFVPNAEVVEQLEQGLRPDGASSPDRYDLDDTAASVDRFLQASDGHEDGEDVGDDDTGPQGRYGAGGTGPGAFGDDEGP